jgi:hypothetical protein
VWLYQNGSLLGVEPGDTDDRVELDHNMAHEAIARRFAPAGTAGLRSVHRMSGRVE